MAARSGLLLLLALGWAAEPAAFAQNSGKPIVSLRGHKKSVRHLAFSSDCKRLVSSDGSAAWPANLAVTWETGSWKAVSQLLGSDVKEQRDHVLLTSPDLTR